jgi:hypothetical protein
MKFLLSVIALCLVMITAKLYVPQVQAEVDGMNWVQLIRDDDFRTAVRRTVRESCFLPYPTDQQMLSNMEIKCVETR